MQRWGKTAKGKQRYRCAHCKVTATKQRSDSSERIYQRLFVEWLTTSVHLRDIAKRTHCTVRSLYNYFERLWAYEPQPIIRPARVIAIDGVGIVKHELVALVTQNVERSEPVWWQFASRESFAQWLSAVRAMKTHGIAPDYVVCDGQRGLTRALCTVWPRITPLSSSSTHCSMPS